MDVSSTPAAASTATVSKSTAKSDGVGLADDFDTFLTLLTTQLQNQDPLSPTDTNEFTNQLVQFTNVEQSIKSNSNLETLIALNKASASRDAVSYIGKQVTLDDDTGYLQNGQAQWQYNLGADAASSSLVITDPSGIPVRTIPGATTIGSHNLTWDGKNDSGFQLPDGQYRLKVIAKDKNGGSISTTISVTGTVTGVAPNDGSPQVNIGTASYEASKIKSVGLASQGQGS